MKNNLFDKKTTEYEFLSSSTELPFKSENDVKFIGNQVNNDGMAGTSQTINSILDHLVDNDLYNEQLITNLRKNRNVPGAAITGLSDEIISASQEGQKFVLTSNADPHVQIVKRINSDANATLTEISSLNGRRINFIIDDSQKYVVGTDNGLYCSDNRLSGWRMVDKTDYFNDPFEGYDCRCCIRNEYQGNFGNELDNYQYFLGTSESLFGLDNSDYYNDIVIWRNLGNLYDIETILSGRYNSLKLDPINKCLHAGKDNGIITIGEDKDNILSATVEIYSDGFKTYDLELLSADNLRKSDEYILAGTNQGIKQSTTRYFPNNVEKVHTYDDGEIISAFGINKSLMKYVGTNKGLYTNISSLNSFNGKSVTGIDFLYDINGNEKTEFVVADGKVYSKDISDLNWTELKIFDPLNSKAKDVRIINNQIVAVITNECKVYYSELIKGQYLELHSIDKPSESGTDLNDVGDDNSKIYVATNMGADIYTFGEAVNKQAILKIDNDLKDVGIDNIFQANNYLFAVNNEHMMIYVSTTNNLFKTYESYQFSSVGSSPSDIKRILFDNGKYFIFTDVGIFYVDSFDNFNTAIKLSFGEKQIDDFIQLIHNESNATIFVSDSKTYFTEDEITDINVNSTVSVILSNLENFNELYSEKLKQYVDIKYDNNELSQYFLADFYKYEKDYDLYAISTNLDANKKEIQNINGNILELSDENALDILYINSGSNEALFFKESNALKFPDYNRNILSDDNTYLSSISNVKSYGFSIPYKDIQYLREIAFVGKSSNGLEIYGSNHYYGLIFKAIGQYTPEPEHVLSSRLLELYPYGTKTGITINDIDFSHRVFENYSYNGGILALGGNDKLYGLALHFFEKNLTDFNQNKNYWADFNVDYNVVSKVLLGTIKSIRYVNNENVYLTDEGIFGFNISSNNDIDYFTGIGEKTRSRIGNDIVYESYGKRYYLATDEFILSSKNISGNWESTNSSFSDFSCSRVVEILAEREIVLKDSLNNDNIINYDSEIPVFFVYIKNKNSQPWNDCYIFDYFFENAYSLDGTNANQISSETSHDGKINGIVEFDNSNILVYSTDETSFSISSISNLKFEDNSINTTIEPILTGNYRIDKILTDSYNGLLFILNEDSSSVHLYSYDGTNGENVSAINIFNLNTIVADTSISNETTIYGFINETISYFDGNGFKDIFKTNSSGNLKDVCTIQTMHDDEQKLYETTDIFNDVKLFTYDNRDTYIVSYGINSDLNTAQLEVNVPVSKVASYHYENFNIVAALGTASASNSLSIFSFPSDQLNDVKTYDVSSFNLIGNIVDMKFQKFYDYAGENDYLFILFGNENAYPMKRIKLNININENKVEYNINCDEPYFSNFISAISMPDNVNSINSFATYYIDSDNYEDEEGNDGKGDGEEDENDGKFDYEKTIFFSTNVGLAYLSNTLSSEIREIHVFELSSTNNSLTLPGNNYNTFEIENNIYGFDSESKKAYQIDKTTLIKNTSQTINGATGLYDLTFLEDENANAYLYNSSNYVLSTSDPLKFDNNSNTVNTGRMNYIMNVPMNAAYAGEYLSNSLFGSLSGMYCLQDYSEHETANSEHILSTLNIDCIEFANNDPIFSMHMICLDLEFDYISSTIEDLTKETFLRVQSIDRISENEIAIVDNETIQIYNIDLSQTIYLDMLDFKDKINEPINSIHPMGVTDNYDAYLAVNGNILMKFNSWEKKRVFDIPHSKYSILYRKFRNSTVKDIYEIDDQNFIIGTDNSVHSVKKLRMDIALKDENGIPISSETNVIGDVISDISHGYAKKYLFSSGNILYHTYNTVFPYKEIYGIPSGKTITSLFTERDGMYLIGTINGLYATTPTYILDDEMTKNNVESVTELIREQLKLQIDSHIETYHDNNVFLSVLNGKLTTSPEKVPDWFTSISEPLAYNSIMLVSSDIVQSIEFNDSNKYIRGSVQNWITGQYGGSSIYSEPGYVDQITDPIDGTKVDFSEIPYICKIWNSGMKEFIIYVPTTMTFYINNPKGFTNSIYNEDSIPRKNAGGIIVSNIVPEKCTKFQLIINNNHFGIKNISMVQINGNSLPLRIYRDSTYCQKGRENLFDTVIEPSEVNSLPTIFNQGVNNINAMVDSSGFIRINFSVYGTDSQSIRILAN